MNVVLRQDWQSFVDNLVEKGRFDTPADAVNAGLRLLQEQEAKLQALRDVIEASIAEGGEISDVELAARIDADLAEIAASDNN